MKKNFVLKITILTIVLIAVVVPTVFAQNEVSPTPQVSERKLKDVIIEGIPACKKIISTGDKTALRLCLKEKIITFLKDKSRLKRTSRSSAPAVPSQRTVVPLPATSASSSEGTCKYSCSSPDRSCSDFSSNIEAQTFFECCGFTRNNDSMQLDSVGVGDGVACESQ